MKVKCIHRQGSRVPDEVLALGNTADTVFNVTDSQIYGVYAMCLWTRVNPRTSVIHYLILDDTQRPDWYPAPLFEVVDSHLPPAWHYGFWGKEPDYQVQAIWGYAEIVLDKGLHYSALMERDSDALAIFNKRRDEIDASLSADDLAFE